MIQPRDHRLIEESRAEIRALVTSAAALTRSLAFLPYDPEADARIEAFMADQGKKGRRRPVARK